ncbi:glycosyltransferase [Salinithrix halophila]|uniref:Glycosyltransferase n=1 Tax=Salinithrix halophila TaxID=1485204 RepID=A0ABV8JF85_9BACL
MRVLMILFRDIHYDARVQQEAVALAKAGWEVDIACVYTTIQPPPELHERIRLLRFPIHTKRLKRYVERKADQRVKRGVYRVVRNPFVKLAKDVVAQRQFALRIWGLCEGADYDVVHCHDLSTLSIGVYLKRKKGCTLVYDSHELFNERNGKGRWQRAMGYRAESLWIDHVDQLVTVNELMEQEFKNRYSGVETTVVRSIPDPLEGLPDEEEKTYFHRYFGLEPESKVVLFQGTFVKNSGLEELIQAFTRLPARMKLVLLGDGERKEVLESLIREKKLEGRIFFHPPLLPRDMLKISAHADLGTALHQSNCLNHSLSTPNRIFEYIQAGLPVIASEQPGKSIIVGTYKTGRLVDPLSVPEIAQAIEEILSEPFPYFIGTLKARKRMTWEQEQKRLVELYGAISRERQEATAEDRGEEYLSIQPHLREL